METTNAPDLATHVAQLKEAIEKGKADLLKTFEFVPEEKLAWSPAPEARSPLWIVGHCGHTNAAFATVIGGGEFGMPADPEAAGKMIRNGGRDVKTRAEAIEMLESSTRALHTALDTVTKERHASMVSTPFGPMPMAFLMSIPGDHMSAHARQVDYLETCWNDLTDHR